MAAILAGAVALSAGVGMASTVPASAGVKIAVVNIIKLSDRLEEKTAQTDKLQKMLANFKAEQAKRQQVLKKLAEPLNPQSTIALKPGTPEYKAQEKKWEKATVAYRVFIDFTQLRIRSEHALLVEKLYHDITTAIKAYAKAHGIGLVLQQEPMDTSVATDKALMVEIRSRKVLYASHEINITDPLLRIMNRQWEKTHGQ
jgi:Skp family chaperone for outer membrane proteins